MRLGVKQIWDVSWIRVFRKGRQSLGYLIKEVEIIVIVSACPVL